VRQWTDATAAVLAMQSYSPFGVPRASLAVAQWGFTGEWHDPGGLVYLRARWYNPYLGRLTQPDTVAPNRGDPQSLNRYTYASNNPLRYTDPTGHYVFEESPDDPVFTPPQPGLPAVRSKIAGEPEAPAGHQIPTPTPSPSSTPTWAPTATPCRTATATPEPTATSTPTTGPYTNDPVIELARMMWGEQRNTHLEEERMTAVGFVAMNSLGKWGWSSNLFVLLAERFTGYLSEAAQTPWTDRGSWELAKEVAMRVYHGTAEDNSHGAVFCGDGWYGDDEDPKKVYPKVMYHWEHTEGFQYWTIPSEGDLVRERLIKLIEEGPEAGRYRRTDEAKADDKRLLVLFLTNKFYGVVPK
jgi:RHS repeat-associated protein